MANFIEVKHVCNRIDIKCKLSWKVNAIYMFFTKNQNFSVHFWLNLPASGTLSVFSWMRKPYVGETHVACIHLKHRKKEERVQKWRWQLAQKSEDQYYHNIKKYILKVAGRTVLSITDVNMNFLCELFHD